MVSRVRPMTVLDGRLDTFPRAYSSPIYLVFSFRFVHDFSHYTAFVSPIIIIPASGPL